MTPTSTFDPARDHEHSHRALASLAFSRDPEGEPQASPQGSASHANPKSPESANRQPRLRPLFLLLTLIALALSLLPTTGCATVKPWQRESLADPIMRPDRYPLAAAQRDHVYFSREAASGSSSVSGGGCGCN